MLHMIAALDRGRGIGRENHLLCHLSADLKQFKSLTTDHTIIMGRKTFESLPKLLPRRTHWVVTQQADYAARHSGIIVFHSPRAVRRALLPDVDYFIIGGASLYQEFLDAADSLYLTEIEAQLPADTFFPKLDMNQWQICSKEPHQADDRNEYNFSFVHYRRKR